MKNFKWQQMLIAFIAVLVIFAVLNNSPREGFEGGLSDTAIYLIALGGAIVIGGGVFFAVRDANNSPRLQGTNTPRKI